LSPAGCATYSSDAPTTTSPAATTVADPPDDGAATPFPVPIVEGGAIVDEFPGEVRVAYPEAMLEPLVDFYTTYATEREGNGGELFDGGVEYQFTQDGDTIVVTVTPEPPDAIVLIRVLP
jgi:hypothetical protein